MYLSVILVRGMLDALQRCGASTDELLDVAGLRDALVSDPRTLLTAEQLELLVERAIALAGDPALGLRVGAIAPEGFGQLVSHVALAAPTLPDAFTQFARFGPLLGSGMSFSLSGGPKRARLTYTIRYALGAQATRFVAEFLAVHLASLGSRRFGRGTEASSFGFAYARPEYGDKYAHALHAPASFGHPAFTIDFPADWLENKQAYADAHMLHELGELAEKLLAKVNRPVSLVERVNMRVRNTPSFTFDAEEVARDLRMSVRALRRRLAMEGVSLSGMRERLRQERAQRELLRPEVNVKDVSEQLGYSEPSAFHRAFKRWTGLTPIQYVQMHSPVQDSQERTPPC